MKLSLSVEGMSCEHCVMTVTKAISEVPGVNNVKVDLGSKKAEFDAESEEVMEKVREAVKKAGYKPA